MVRPVTHLGIVSVSTDIGLEHLLTADYVESSMTTNRQWLLHERPVGMIGPEQPALDLAAIMYFPTVVSI